MYNSPTVLNAPIKFAAATDMTKSMKPLQKKGKVFTEMNNLYGLNAMRQDKKTLMGKI
jgi:hypothetical protein|tara:strand:+ start:2245 stop:2418 length:174 start_codon:yes stop_codon:yes gene_type:complete